MEEPEKITIRFHSEEEKERAEQILNLLAGMSIHSARKLLKKCRKALLGNTASKAKIVRQSRGITCDTKSGGCSSDSIKSENCD